MRSLILPLVLLSAAPAPAQPRTPDEAAVREVVRKYVEARELRSPDAVAALFTADVDQHTTTGEWRRGRAEVVAGTQRASAQNVGTRRITIDTVRFASPDVAIADGPYEIVAPNTPTRRMWTTIVLSRAADGWRISAIRNAIPAVDGAPPR